MPIRGCKAAGFAARNRSQARKSLCTQLFASPANTWRVPVRQRVFACEDPFRPRTCDSLPSAKESSHAKIHFAREHVARSRRPKSLLMRRSISPANTWLVPVRQKVFACEEPFRLRTRGSFLRECAVRDQFAQRCGESGAAAWRFLPSPFVRDAKGYDDARCSRVTIKPIIAGFAKSGVGRCDRGSANRGRRDGLRRLVRDRAARRFAHGASGEQRVRSPAVSAVVALTVGDRAHRADPIGTEEALRALLRRSMSEFS